MISVVHEITVRCILADYTPRTFTCTVGPGNSPLLIDNFSGPKNPVFKMTRLHHYGQSQHGTHHAVLHAGRQSGAGNAGEHRSVRRAVAMRPSASGSTLGLKERHKQALRGLSTVLWSCLAARRGSGASLQGRTKSWVRTVYQESS